VPYPKAVQQSVGSGASGGDVIQWVKQQGQDENYDQRIYAVQLLQESGHPSKNRKYLVSTCSYWTDFCNNKGSLVKVLEFRAIIDALYPHLTGTLSG
jgi:hypothetical protein